MSWGASFLIGGSVQKIMDCIFSTQNGNCLMRLTEKNVHILTIVMTYFTEQGALNSNTDRAREAP